MGTSDEEDARERGNWRGRLDFVLSATGYVVGLGNVWGFPYKAFKNGGASFLFPYLIMLAICGIPLFFLEVALGQFSSEGPITVWKMAPLFTGVGYGMLIVSAAVCVYYNVLISYAMYYMLVSFVNLDDGPPWESCEHSWNTQQCRSQITVGDEFSFKDRMATLMGCMSSESKSYMVENATSHISSASFTNISTQLLASWAELCLRKDVENETVSATQEFFLRYAIREDKSHDISNLGPVSVKLCLTLLITWVIVFASLFKGIQTSRKVVHVTATFPFIILFVIFIKGLTLEGHWNGIKFYLVPVWGKLLEITVWKEAAAQLFYSLGIGFGGILTLSSYNKFYNNCYRDTFLVTMMDSVTSVFAGFAIFSVLGHISHVTKRPIAEVVSSDVDLAFVAYPEGLSTLPGSSFWSFLFFLMLVTLGLDSQFGMLETVTSAISDLSPHIVRKHKAKFTLCCCVVGFLLGIPQTTQGGRQVLRLMDQFSASYNIMLIALAEVICVMYVYGMTYFRDDIKMMIGFQPSYYWIATWAVLTPLSIVFILVTTLVQHLNTESKKEPEEFPVWALVIGWTLASLPVGVMIVVGIIQAYRYKWPGMIQPTKSWGPALPENRVGRYVYSDQPPSVLDFVPPGRRAMSNSVPARTNGHSNSGYIPESGESAL